MKKNFVAISILLLLLTSCTKNIEIIQGITGKGFTQITSTATSSFTKYTILQGEQYCDKNSFQSIKTSEISFIAKFDSSAIYKTINPNNQADINKLYGFSDNNALHHDFSARFGWNWTNNALHLFGYIYNNNIMSFKELGTVSIGTENSCSIKVTNNSYIFTLNGKAVTMPRTSTTMQAEGYRLYPYFGGDEMAPHTVSIWIKDL